MIKKNKLNRYATSFVVDDTKSTIFNNNENNEINEKKPHNEILDRNMNNHIERRLYYKNSNNNINNINNIKNKIKNSNNKYYIEHEDCIQNNSCSL